MSEAVRIEPRTVESMRRGGASIEDISLELNLGLEFVRAKVRELGLAQVPKPLTARDLATLRRAQRGVTAVELGELRGVPSESYSKQLAKLRGLGLLTCDASTKPNTWRLTAEGAAMIERETVRLSMRRVR